MADKDTNNQPEMDEPEMDEPEMDEPEMELPNSTVLVVDVPVDVPVEVSPLVDPSSEEVLDDEDSDDEPTPLQRPNARGRARARRNTIDDPNGMVFPLIFPLGQRHGNRPQAQAPQGHAAEQQLNILGAFLHAMQSQNQAQGQGANFAQGQEEMRRRNEQSRDARLRQQLVQMGEVVAQAGGVRLRRLQANPYNNNPNERNRGNPMVLDNVLPRQVIADNANPGLRNILQRIGHNIVDRPPRNQNNPDDDASI